MDKTRDIVGILAEVFTWIGLVPGILCLLALWMLRLARGEWVETEAVVVEGERGQRLRWMSHDGAMHARGMTAAERERAVDADALRIHYRRRSPSRAHLDPIDQDMRTLRLLSFILLGVFVLATIVSLAVLFVPA